MSEHHLTKPHLPDLSHHTSDTRRNPLPPPPRSTKPAHPVLSLKHSNTARSLTMEPSNPSCPTSPPPTHHQKKKNYTVCLAHHGSNPQRCARRGSCMGPA
ncbi:hypothetical protein PtA15_8A198 [Puccinia triticina]|uniref:Uncharacterized protein n=1 Tax=Puccinia triticina TaxID=208348 RepID=A0ABY7CRK8_9BASI|nr:uncharacterized protein PtA15_8A198 [Puccinia triticina]WAQ87294.1 hypothetical protein PtA15_8A198 [Puccinia triticina]